MSADLATLVTSNLRGQEDAKRDLVSWQTTPGTGDELFRRVLTLADLGDVARLRGFCGLLQKRLERQ